MLASKERLKITTISYPLNQHQNLINYFFSHYSPLLKMSSTFYLNNFLLKIKHIEDIKEEKSQQCQRRSRRQNQGKKKNII